MTTYLTTDPIMISKGNDKIGKIPNVSLPPIISCVPGVPCATEKRCYSLKAWRQYKNVRDARMHNWRTWLNEPDRYFKDIRYYFETKQPRYFRFHVDGDIPNTDYFNRMLELADDFPTSKILTFTKRYDLPINKCPFNLVIVPSAWPEYKMPKTFERIAWMEDGREDRYMHSRFECNKKCDECFACWHIYEIGKDVVFHKH